MNDKKQFRTALLQIPVALGDRRANMESVEGWFKEYYKPSEMTTAVVLPELWDTGYALDVVPQVADKNAAQTTDFLGRLAKQYGCWFTGGSVMAEENGKFYNRSLIVNPAGDLVTHYDKVHLVPFITVEDGVFEHGEKPCIFDMDGITCGSIICYDIRFPEWIRVYALKGVEALFICSQWTRSRMDLYRTMIRAHAIENMFFTVAVNNCDYSGDIDFGGESFVSSPTGEVLASCSGTRDAKFAEIDVTNINENRQFLKVFEKRLPHLYGDLVK
ncbi:MAG: nitrilase-related carbon-nitrogen hydrolase [Cloacibacillus sp.]